jgi:hypothetical protein
MSAHYRRNVTLAVCLLIGGCILLIIGVRLYLEDDPASSGGACPRIEYLCFLTGTQQHSNMTHSGLHAGIALTTLGCVLFLPGSYYSWVAYKDWRLHEYSAELMALR